MTGLGRPFRATSSHLSCCDGDHPKGKLRPWETIGHDLEAEQEALASGGRDDYLSLHRQVNELELEIDSLNAELERIENELEEKDERVENRGTLQSDSASKRDAIADLRSKIDRLEREAVVQFNEQMDALIDLLGFENVERLWIERVETEVKEGRKTVPKTQLDLHIIRSSESGSVYEDTIDHLSESELELVGIVFALSGYLVHEVYERVPFMLLDSIEAFDADRRSTLVDYLAGYLAGYADLLVVALLPEDAAALDDDYQRMTEI